MALTENHKHDIERVATSEIPTRLGLLFRSSLDAEEAYEEAIIYLAKFATDNGGITFCASTPERSITLFLNGSIVKFVSPMQASVWR